MILSSLLIKKLDKITIQYSDNKKNIDIHLTCNATTKHIYFLNINKDEIKTSNRNIRNSQQMEER